jgi:hypothetical protein
MRPTKITAFIMLLACVTLLCGCSKSFFYSFQDEQSLDNGDVQWQMLGNGLHVFRPAGLSLNDGMLLCPFAFNGDVTLKINIVLDCANKEGILFRLIIGKEPAVFPAAFSVMTFYVNSIEQGLEISEKDTSKKIQKKIDGIVPGINKAGDNELILEKKGDQYTYTLNGVLLGEYTAELYFADWFFVQMFGTLGTGATVDTMIIKDFTAIYSGQMQEL